MNIEIIHANCTYDSRLNITGFVGAVKINGKRYDGEFALKEEYDGEVVDFLKYLNRYYESHRRAN